MEITSEVNLENHQSWTVLGLHKVTFSTKDSCIEYAAISTNDSLEHRGDDFCSKAQSSLLERSGDITTNEKAFVCAVQKNIQSVKTVCFLETEEKSAIPREASPDTAQLLESKLISLRTNQNCCGNFSPPPPESEDQSSKAVQNHPDETLDFNCEYFKIDRKNFDPVTLNQNSIPTTEVPAAIPEYGLRVLDLPHIVKHKQSSITFSDYTCPPTGNGYSFVNESSDDGGSSQEGEQEDDDGHHDSDNDDDDDDDDNDVFPELPHGQDLLVHHRQRNAGKEKEKKKLCMSSRAGNDHTLRSCGYEAEGETSSEKVCFKIFSFALQF